jgi:hypothetical protein
VVPEYPVGYLVSTSRLLASNGGWANVPDIHNNLAV